MIFDTSAIEQTHGFALFLRSWWMEARNIPAGLRFDGQSRGPLLAGAALNTYISVFLFEYWFSFPSIKVLTSLSVSDTDFSVLAAVISENSHKLPWIENGEGFAVHSSNLTKWRERRVTFSY